MVWVDDAAQAVVAALERALVGVYDVVDDEPLRRDDILAAFARFVGRGRLVRLPTWLLRLLGGAGVATLSRSPRVSNRRFKEATGWAPAVSMSNARIGCERLGAYPIAQDRAGRSQDLVQAR